MTLEQEIDRALAEGDHRLAAMLAADLPDPIAYRKAMERAFEASKQGPRQRQEISMSQFALKNQVCKLKSINTRWELAGRDVSNGRTAMDIGLQIKDGNAILEKLSPHLRGQFYRADVDKNGLLLPGALTKLIDDRLQTDFSYNYKGAGYTVSIAHGGNPESAIDLEECQINDFKIQLLEGGAVGISLRVQFHPEPGQHDLLAAKLQQEVLVTMEPPADADAPQTGDLLDGNREPADATA